MCHTTGTALCSYLYTSYLLGGKFTICADHGSLIWLSNFKEPKGQLARWIEQLQEYNFTIIHRPGRKHGNADALSRQPCQQCGRIDHFTSTIITHVTDQVLNERTEAQIQALQLDNPSIHNMVLRAIESNDKPTSEHARGTGPEAQQLVQLWSRESLTMLRELLHGHSWYSLIAYGKKLCKRCIQE